MIYKVEFVTLWENRYKGPLVDLKLLRQGEKNIIGNTKYSLLVWNWIWVYGRKPY